MNDKNVENKQIEDLLRKAHPPGPSAKLKERITTEAKKTWIKTSSELPWQIPVRRLIVSAAAAVLIIWLTNCSSDYFMVRWKSSRPKMANQQHSDFDALMEIPYSPLARHLVSVRRKPSITEASAFRNYAEKMLLILDESQQNRASKPTAPIKGRSHLFPTQSHIVLYS